MEGEQLELGSKHGKHIHHPRLTALSPAAALLAALFTGEGVAVLRNSLGFSSS